MEQLSREQFAHDLDLPLESLNLIKEGIYCYIYRSTVNGQPLIVKKYKGKNHTQVTAEAQALDFYHELARDRSPLIDIKTIKVNLEKNLICIDFVQGECFSNLLYRGRGDRQARQRAVRMMTILGDLLRQFYDRTLIPHAEIDGFIYNYFDYCSEKLEKTPLLGPLLFRGYQDSAANLVEDVQACGMAPSFMHGDLVSANILVWEERLGLIDFAHSSTRGHLLNDVYSLLFSLVNMWLPWSFKEVLLTAFCDGLGTLAFPGSAHRFYSELHRRRWLMLKIKTRNPHNWLQAMYGLLGVTRPFDPEMMVL